MLKLLIFIALSLAGAAGFSSELKCTKHGLCLNDTVYYTVLLSPYFTDALGTPIMKEGKVVEIENETQVTLEMRWDKQSIYEVDDLSTMSKTIIPQKKQCVRGICVGEEYWSPDISGIKLIEVVGIGQDAKFILSEAQMEGTPPDLLKEFEGPFSLSSYGLGSPVAGVCKKHWAVTGVFANVQRCLMGQVQSADSLDRLYRSSGCTTSEPTKTSGRKNVCVGDQRGAMKDEILNVSTWANYEVMGVRNDKVLIAKLSYEYGLREYETWEYESLDLNEWYALPKLYQSCTYDRRLACPLSERRKGTVQKH